MTVDDVVSERPPMDGVTDDLIGTGKATTGLVPAFRLATMRLSRRVRQHADDRLTPSRYSALMTISRCGPLSLGGLADREHVSQSTITRIAAHLEKDGLVERRQNPDDGRSAFLQVTPAGKDALTATEGRMDAYLSRRVAALSEDERESLADALPVLERILEIEP